MVTLENVSDVAVVSRSLSAPGPVLVISWSSSDTNGVATSQTVNHSSFTSTMFRRFPSRTSLRKGEDCTILWGGVCELLGHVLSPPPEDPDLRL